MDRMFDRRRFSIALPMTNKPLASSLQVSLRPAQGAGADPSCFFFFFNGLTYIIYPAS